MKALLMMMACMFLALSMSAQDCVKNLRGGVAQGPNGTTAAVNANTGNAVVAQKNQNGVTTTQTTNGGKAKTKNGMGVAQGPGGTTCVKGANHQGCKK